MLAQIDDLKNALGIDPAEIDLARDRLLESSLRMANALLAAYIGYDVSDVDTERVFTTIVDNNACYIKLPVFPIIEVTGMTSDGLPLAVTDYALNNRTGILDCLNGWVARVYENRYGHRVTVTYRAGYEEVPEDLIMVCLNIAATVYNMGGTLDNNAVAGAGGSGALKSLTMFDAMSMSFDTGATVPADNSPAGLLKPWSFVLKQYRTNTPVMA